MKKKSIWQRIQAIICFLLLLCVFASFGLLAVSPQTARRLVELTGIGQLAGLAAALDGFAFELRVLCGAGAALGLICSLRLLTLVFARGGRDRSGVALQNAAEGPIHISVPAVETLVSQGIRDMPGLSDVRMKVHDFGDSVSIDVAMSARSDINIPDTMLRLQSRIKEYVQESAGIDVREVRLNVEKVVLADGIQALPAGRGMKRAGSSAQAASPDDKADEPEPAAPQPASALDDDDDTDADWNRKGWFGRFGHKKREADVDAGAVERAAQGDDAASVPSQDGGADGDISVKAHIAEYMTGEAGAEGAQAQEAPPSAGSASEPEPAAQAESARPEPAVQAEAAQPEPAVQAEAAQPEPIAETEAAQPEPAVAPEVEAAQPEPAASEPEQEAVKAEPDASEAKAQPEPQVACEAAQPAFEPESATADAEPEAAPEQAEPAAEPERAAAEEPEQAELEARGALDFDAVVADAPEERAQEAPTIVIGDTSEDIAPRSNAPESAGKTGGVIQL